MTGTRRSPISWSIRIWPPCCGAARQAWRRSVALAVARGLPVPALSFGAGLLRRLPQRAALGQPDPGSAGLFRRPRFRAHRPAGTVPRRLARLAEDEDGRPVIVDRHGRGRLPASRPLAKRWPNTSASPWPRGTTSIPRVQRGEDEPAGAARRLGPLALAGLHGRSDRRLAGRGPRRGVDLLGPEARLSAAADRRAAAESVWFICAARGA